MSRNLQFLSSRKGLRNGLFEQYARIAAERGTVPDADISRLSEESLIGEAPLLGAVSFYEGLGAGRMSKPACVCSGSACLTAGRQEAIRKALRARFAEEDIGEVCCLGRCYEAGAFSLHGRNWSGHAPEDVNAIIDGEIVPEPTTYNVGCNLDSPLLVGKDAESDSCYETLLSALKQSPEALLSEIKTSKLRGRGGAGFPLATKWQSCREVDATPKYIVCNADEGDPGAFSDRYLLEERPHLVLAGMIAAGFIVGAEFGVLYIRSEYPESIVAVEKAISDLDARGLLGKPLGKSGLTFDIQIAKGAGAYICGEETALLASLEGLRPEVRIRPPYPTVSGLFGKPTVVNNVETLALVPPMLRMGGEAFSQIGTPGSTGTKLVSLDSFFKKPGVYEVAMGTPFLEVIEEMGGGFREPVKALQVGGPLGCIVPQSEWENLTLDFESFSQRGFLLGHAGIVSIPESFRMLDYLAHLFLFTAQESCGKCFPCRLGSIRGFELLEKAAREKTTVDPVLLDDLLETLELGSLCALGGGLPLSIRNALTHFATELAPWFGQRK